MRLNSKRCWVIAFAITGLSAIALAEDAVVKLPSAKIRNGKGPGYTVLAELKKGDKLQVIAHEGTYVKVKSGSTEGYLGENSVASSSGGNAFGGLGEAASAFSSGSKGASESAAGKGDLRALDLARTKGQSTAGLQRMLELKKQVAPGDWEAFEDEGHVGRGKK